MNKVKKKKGRTNNRPCDLPITRLPVPERLVGDEEKLAPFPGVEKHRFTQWQIQVGKGIAGADVPSQWQPQMLLTERRSLGVELLL